MGISRRPNLHLTLAINAYDHVRDLVSGAVPVEGVDLTCLHLPVEEIFYRFARYREWDISEFSLAKYVALRSRGDTSLVAIPVFPSRIFRHSAIFVREDGPVDDPRALAGGRIGLPEWTQTATVYVRGLLQHEYGIGLDQVTWVQAGTNQPGRVEGIELRPPPGISLTPVPDRTLNDMLLAGELDAVIAAHPPSEFERRTGRIRRLFTDHQAVEETYYRRTGIFPIMHVVVLRSEVYHRHPWVAMNLFTAFEAAKQHSLERILDSNVSHLPMPWVPATVERAQRTFGSDPWPYGVEPNRRTLEAFLSYALEQGVCADRLEPEDLFVPEIRSRFRI